MLASHVQWLTVSIYSHMAIIFLAYVCWTYGKLFSLFLHFFLTTHQKRLQIDGVGHIFSLCSCPLGSTVMILGVTILRKKYPMAKYLCVFLIVTGVALFLYKPNKGSSASDEHTFGFGEMLLVGLSLNLFVSLPYIQYHFLFSVKADLMCVCLIAAVSDSGWSDGCSSGPHEGTVPDGSQSHDAEHQHVVHTGP